jgi:hypothetical protein
MKLPNGEKAEVAEAKVTRYLLSPWHRHGRSKENFFSRFGFSHVNWQDLVQALLQHAVDHEVVKVESTAYGRRYVIEGSIVAPDGRTPRIRTVWFIRTDEDIPRFVTAYPLGRRAQ